MTIIAADMIKETRGRKRNFDLNLGVMEQREFPKSEANKVRVAISHLKNNLHPTWNFRTWIDGEQLIIVRTK